MLIHASCVVLSGKGVLIAGAPGAGKSDLALRLIDEGAQLVSDDQTELSLESGTLVAAPPAAIAGLMEIRQYGLVRIRHAEKAPVTLYVELAPPGEKLERIPENDAVYLLDRPVRRLRLLSFAASTPAKIRAVLSYPSISGHA